MFLLKQTPISLVCEQHTTAEQRTPCNRRNKRCCCYRQKGLHGDQISDFFLVNQLDRTPTALRGSSSPPATTGQLPHQREQPESGRGTEAPWKILWFHCFPKAPGSQDDEGVKAFSCRRREQRAGRKPPIEEGRTRRQREAGEADGFQHSEPNFTAELTLAWLSPAPGHRGRRRRRSVSSIQQQLLVLV